jgi:hypothetical protein
MAVATNRVKCAAVPDLPTAPMGNRRFLGVAQK